jgi:hypothetical protein
MKTRMIVVACLGVVGIGLLVFLMRPVCKPLGQDNLARFNVPAIQRMEQRDWYLRVCQQKRRERFECKTYLSRRSM